MRLFMFKSEGNNGLHAFAPDPGGEQLPPRHGPWTAVGVVREDKDPPHRMSRAAIEKSIAEGEKELDAMRAKLKSAPGDDWEKLAELAKNEQALQRKVDSMLVEWAQLSEELA